MACPYFFPVARFETSPWTIPPRLPLGDAFSGECRASGTTLQPPAQPDETRMRAVCNLGYGRHDCEQFPEGSAADAVRFHIAIDAHELINIQYVFEKDCWPTEHGDAAALTNEILRRQAQVYLESYLRRRSET
jgi:hypothetical protein